MIWFRINNTILDLNTFQRIYLKTQEQDAISAIGENATYTIGRIYGVNYEETMLLWAGEVNQAQLLFDRMWGAISSTTTGYDDTFIEQGV